VDRTVFDVSFMSSGPYLEYLVFWYRWLYSKRFGDAGSCSSYISCSYNLFWCINSSGWYGGMGTGNLLQFKRVTYMH